MKSILVGCSRNLDTRCEHVPSKWECKFFSNRVPRSKVILPWIFLIAQAALGSMFKTPPLGLKFSRCVTYMIQDANVQKNNHVSCKNLTLTRVKVCWPCQARSKKKNSSNFKCYNLSIRAVKVSEIFSIHSHSSLVQICMVEFWKKKLFFHFFPTALKNGSFSQF